MSDLGSALEELDRKYNALDAVNDEYGKATEELGNASASHRISYAKALIVAQGSSEAIKRAAADVATEAELFRLEAAKGRVDYLKQLLLTIRSQADMKRTEAATYRSV